MDKINDLIEKNTGLVYTQLKRFNLRMDQDAESLAYEALYKAVITYDDNAGSKFSTYATCVIANALRMHLRNVNRKRQLSVISYHETIGSDDFYLLDTIVGAESAENEILKSEQCTAIDRALRCVYDSLTSTTQRNVLTVWKASGFTKKQGDIAKELGISQPAVSNALSAIRYKIKQALEEQL